MKNKARTTTRAQPQIIKSSGSWYVAKGRHVTARSNAVMDTHCMISLTIENLVSPSSSFFVGQVRGRTWPAPPNETTVRSRLLGKAGPSIRHVTTCLGGPRFRWSRDRFVAQLFFSFNPVLDIFSVFAAALKIQLMSSANDLFSRWFSASKHGNLLRCQHGGRSADLRI